MDNKTTDPRDYMNIRLVKRLLDENLVSTVLTDATYEDSFRLSDDLNIAGDFAQYEVVEDFITLNYDDDIDIYDDNDRIYRKLKKSKWISMVNSINDFEKHVQNMIDYYRTILSCYDDYNDDDSDFDEYSIESTILNDLYNDRVRWDYMFDRQYCYEIDIALNRETYKLLYWVTEDMYTITSADIPKAEILDDDLCIDGQQYTKYTESVHRRILMESIFYNRLNIGGTLTNKRSAAIEYLYGYHKRIKYILYALMGINELDVKNLSSIRISCPQLPDDIMDSDTMVNQEYTYTIYTDRSNNSPDYAYERRITVPFSSKKHVYLIRHEPHSPDHIKMALELCILTDKTTAKIVNTYDGTMYTVTSKLTTADITFYDRLLRANDIVIYSDSNWDISYDESASHSLVVSCIRDGDNVYEYAALVYDHKRYLIIDCIVLTNSKAKIDVSLTITEDQKQSHGFVIEDIGEDIVMTQQLLEFIGRYPNAPITYYNIRDPSMLRTDKREIIPLPYYMNVKDVSSLESLYDEMIEERYYYDEDKDPIPLLFNRALDECIAIMKVGVHYALQTEYHMNCDSCRTSDSDSRSVESFDYDMGWNADIWYNGDATFYP